MPPLWRVALARAHTRQALLTFASCARVRFRAVGMVDRGCELDWISQYPFERECLFAPLTSFELLRTRVDKDVMVAEVRLNVNL